MQIITASVTPRAPGCDDTGSSRPYLPTMLLQFELAIRANIRSRSVPTQTRPFDTLSPTADITIDIYCTVSDTQPAQTTTFE